MNYGQLTPDDLTGMCVFARVVDTGSMTAAAESLSISKASVSKILHALESALAARLLQRTTRCQSLTEVGRAYYELCQKMLKTASEARDTVNRFSSEPIGTLKMSAPINFGNLYIAPLLTKLSMRYPKLKIDLALSDDVCDLVRDQYDIALRVADKIDEQLIARPVAVIRWVVCASPEYLARTSIPLMPEQLSTHNCLLYSQLCPGQSWEFQIDGTQINVPVGGSISINSSYALMNAALDGCGIVRIPTYLASSALQTGRLVPLLLPFSTAPQIANVVYTRGRYLMPKVRVVIEFLREHFGGMESDPSWDNWMPALPRNVLTGPGAGKPAATKLVTIR